MREQITVEQYLPYIEWQIHPSPEHVQMAEVQALDALVDAFAKEMKAKLHLKLSQGYGGWDNSSLRPILEQKLSEHVERGSGQLVDVAILAAMLWNLGAAHQREEEADV